MNLRAKLGIFLLTAEEQRTIAFVVLALVLGLGTQHYRQRHSQSKPSMKAEASPRITPGSDDSRSDSTPVPGRGRNSD